MKLSFALALTMAGYLSGTQGFARPGSNNVGRTARDMVANPVEKASFTQVSDDEPREDAFVLFHTMLTLTLLSIH